MSRRYICDGCISWIDPELETSPGEPTTCAACWEHDHPEEEVA